MANLLKHLTAFTTLMVCGWVTTNVQAEETKAAATPAEKITYDDHVAPIFRQKCFNCHNADQKRGGLDLTNFVAMMQGGSSGEVLDPGDSSVSYLYLLVTHESTPTMPPNSPKMEPELLATIQKWIDGGALENKGSKAAPRKPKADLTLAVGSTGKPDGPPPMPGRLSLKPVTHTPRTTAITALATSPWAPVAAVAGQKQVLLYSTETSKLLGVLPFPEGVPQVLKFSRNGKLLLAGGGRDSYEGKVIVWDIETGERVLTVGNETDTVLAADISADQSLIALGGPSKIVRVYSTATGNIVYQIKKHTDWVTSLEFSPDGVLLATGDRNGGLHLWEAQTGRAYLTLDGHKAAVTGTSWRADSNILATSGENAAVKLWEMNNGKQVKTWNAHGGGTAAMEFCRDGRVVTAGRDKTTKLWDQNGALKKTFEAFTDLSLRVTHCDTTDRVIAGDWTGEIRVWAAADGKRVFNLSPNPPMLKDQVATLEAELQKVTAQSTQLKAAATAAQAEFQKIQAALTAANTTLAQTKQLVATAATTKQQLVAKMAALTKQRDEAKAKAAALQPVVTALTAALQKLQETQKLTPQDAAVVKLATDAGALVKAKTTELQAAQKAMQDAQTALTAAQAELTKLDAQVTTWNTTITNTTAQITAMTAKVKPAQDKMTAAQQAAAKVAPQLQALTNDLTHYKAELAFATKLEVLNAKETELAQAEAEVLAAQETVAKVQATATAAQQTLAKAQQALTAHQGTVKGKTEELAKTQATLTQVQAGETLLKTQVPTLTQLKTEADKLAATAPADAELKSVATTTSAILTKKQAALTAAQTQVAQIQATIKATTDALTALQKQTQPLTAAITQAEAAMKTAQAAVTAAQAKVTPLAQKRDGLKQVFTQLQTEIAKLKEETTPTMKDAQASAGK